MQRRPILSALLALAVMLVALGAARATEYATNPNPACRTMRNSVPGAPYLPAPNYADARAAALLAGTGEKSPLDHAPEIRRRFAKAFPIMRKIDAEDTTALSALPLDTPRIDGLIDRHLINLIWARSMLAIFYEEGRAPPVDYARAGEFYRKSAETAFTDDRGCVHSWPPAASVLTHLAGYYAYGVGLPQDRAKARELLKRAGVSAWAMLVLLDHDALPQDIGGYLDALDHPARLTDRADALAHPRPASDMPDMMTWITNPDAAMATIMAPAETAMTWVTLAVALLIVATALLWLVHRWRGRLERRASFYRTAFAVYDVIQRIVARIGLLAGGLIGCCAGLWMLLEASVFGLAGPLRFFVLFGGVTALLGGIVKLVEAARLSAAPNNTGVHGAARPAAEAEAHDAARGATKAPDLHGRMFKE